MVFDTDAPGLDAPAAAATVLLGTLYPLLMRLLEGEGLSGGLSMPTGDLGDRADAGYVIAGHVYYKPASIQALRFRGDVSFDRWSIKNADEGADASTRSVVASSISTDLRWTMTSETSISDRSSTPPSMRRSRSSTRPSEW